MIFDLRYDLEFVLFLITLFIFRHIPTAGEIIILSADLAKQNTGFNIITALCTFIATISSGIKNNRELMKEAISNNIPDDVVKKVGGQDHAIIYFEAWNISQKVNLLSDAVRHIEPRDLKTIWRKFYRWGYTSVGAKENKYTELLNRKEKFRKGLFRKGFFKESMGSILLLLIKGVPYKVGYYSAKLKKI